jgi:hypothetical protein
LVGRENLGGGKIRSGEIRDNKIGSDKIGDNKEDIGIVDCEKFFLNYADRCAVSIYSANLNKDFFILVISLLISYS